MTRAKISLRRPLIAVLAAGRAAPAPDDRPRPPRARRPSPDHA